MALDIEERHTPFNMAILYYVGLRQLIMDKNKRRINNDLLGVYNSLEAIYIEISFKMNAPEKQQVRKLLDLAKNYVYPRLTMIESINDQIINLANNRAITVFNEIDILLMDIMDKNKMIFPDIQVDQGFDNIRKKLNLDAKT